MDDEDNIAITKKVATDSDITTYYDYRREHEAALVMGSIFAVIDAIVISEEVTVLIILFSGLVGYAFAKIQHSESMLNFMRKWYTGLGDR